MQHTSTNRLNIGHVDIVVKSYLWCYIKKAMPLHEELRSAHLLLLKTIERSVEEVAARLKEIA